MEVIDKEVFYDQYCFKCKHAKDDEWDENSPCYDCMFQGSNEHSHAPINFISAKKESK